MEISFKFRRFMLKNFFLKETLIIFAIFGVLTTLIIITYFDYTLNAKKEASVKNHTNIINFMKKSLIKCENGYELILKKNLTTNTENLCPTVMQNNALKMSSAFVNHFNTLEWCNTYGLMNSSGNCKQAVVKGAHIEEGNLGETLLIVSENFLFVHTKISTNENITNKIAIK